MPRRRGRREQNRNRLEKESGDENIPLAMKENIYTQLILPW